MDPTLFAITIGLRAIDTIAQLRGGDDQLTDQERQDRHDLRKAEVARYHELADQAQARIDAE